MTPSVRGAVSGFEVNETIDQLMQVRAQPIERKQEQIEDTIEKQGHWQEVDGRTRELSGSLQDLTDRATFTQLQAESTDEDVATAMVTGEAEEATYDMDVEKLATRHSVSTDTGVSDPAEALDKAGEFFLNTGQDIKGVQDLSFKNSEEKDWLEGSPSVGYHAMVDGDENSTYALEVDDLNLAEDAEDAEKIEIYAEDFLDEEGMDQMEDLEEYLQEKGMLDEDEDFNSEEPLLVLEKNDNGEWDQVDARFTLDDEDGLAFKGDHPLGTFSLRAEMKDEEGETVKDENGEAVQDNFQFSIRDEDDDIPGKISLEEEDSLNSLVDKINEDTAKTGVHASVVMKADGDYRLVLESEEEGEENKIQAWGPGNNDNDNDPILEELNLDLVDHQEHFNPEYSNELIEAQNAEFAFNGMNIERTSNTIDDLVEGVEFQLHEEGQTTVEVDTDVERPMELIEEFVERYNEFNSVLRRMQDEDAGEHEELMEEDEEDPLETETDTRRGQLQGDTDLMRMERRVRNIVHGQVEAPEREDPLPANSLAGLGISAGEPSSDEEDYMESTEGFLQIHDSQALEEALREDPEGVYEVFAREAPRQSYDHEDERWIDDEEGQKRGSDGIARQMLNYTDTLIGSDSLIHNREEALNDRIGNYRDRIETEQGRLENYKDRLVRQFTEMERSIARMQGEDQFMEAAETGGLGGGGDDG